VNHYVARIVINYRPRAVVLYAGENDLSWPWSKSPETVSSDFRRFVETIHSQLPGTWICYISMKPTPLRWSNWRTVQKTNKMIEDYSRSQERVQFIDVSTAMLDAQGKPRHELFRWDGLHMNAQGYSLWTLIIRPVLLSRFGQTPHSGGTQRESDHVKSWATYWFSITANPPGSGGGRLGLPLLGTHDDEPQHDGEFAEHHRENPIGDPLLVLRP
jgi:hypothetical protein